jgi:hypothetical protein
LVDKKVWSADSHRNATALHVAQLSPPSANEHLSAAPLTPNNPVAPQYHDNRTTRCVRRSSRLHFLRMTASCAALLTLRSPFIARLPSLNSLLFSPSHLGNDARGLSHNYTLRSNLWQLSQWPHLRWMLFLARSPTLLPQHFHPQAWLNHNRRVHRLGHKQINRARTQLLRNMNPVDIPYPQPLSHICRFPHAAQLARSTPSAR